MPLPEKELVHDAPSSGHEQLIGQFGLARVCFLRHLLLQRQYIFIAKLDNYQEAKRNNGIYHNFAS